MKKERGKKNRTPWLFRLIELTSCVMCLSHFWGLDGIFIIYIYSRMIFFFFFFLIGSQEPWGKSGVHQSVCRHQSDSLLYLFQTILFHIYDFYSYYIYTQNRDVIKSSFDRQTCGLHRCAFRTESNGQTRTGVLNLNNLVVVVVVCWWCMNDFWLREEMHTCIILRVKKRKNFQVKKSTMPTSSLTRMSKYI